MSTRYLRDLVTDWEEKRKGYDSECGYWQNFGINEEKRKLGPGPGMRKRNY